MPTRSATPPKHGPRTAPKIATPNVVPITSPRRSRGAVTEIHASAPAQVAVLAIPWTNRATPSATALSAAAKAKLAIASRSSAPTTCALRPEACRSEAAGDASEQRAGAVRADEETGARLREVELVGVRRHERRQRREEERVDEDDRADEDEEAAHRRRAYARKENAPSRWRPRPTFRLTTAEATTTRRAINLRHSVLGASRTLWTGSSPVKHQSDEIRRNLRPRLRPLVARRSQSASDPIGPELSADLTARATRRHRRSSSTRRPSARRRDGPSGASARCRAPEATCRTTTKCTEPVAPSSGFPTDRRRSGCRSESHQPRTLRTRCIADSRGVR